MKKILLATCLSLSLFAQEDKIEYINEMSLLIGNSENGFSQNVDRSLAYELQFQYNGLDFPIRPEISFVYSQDIPLYNFTADSRTRYITMMGNGVYEIPYSDLLTPYVKAGVGYQSFSDVPDSPPSSLLLDTGVGLKLDLTDRWSLKFEVLGTLDSDHFNILATGGVSFRFGRKYVAPPPEKVCEPCEAPKEVYVPPKPLPVFGAGTIQFEFAKASLTDTSKASLVHYSELLNNSENVNSDIVIVGNTDNKGSRAFNATLSIKRANAVRAELIKNDVDPKRITIEGLGEINPIADNETARGRDKNRRVMIILKEKEPKPQSEATSATE